MKRILALVGIIAVALNLRPALTSLAPLITAIQSDTGLSGTHLGLLTTLPVLCLGLFGPLAPWLARRLSPQGTMALFLADRKSTRLSSSHVASSYAVFCLKKQRV